MKTISFLNIRYKFTGNKVDRIRNVEISSTIMNLLLLRKKKIIIKISSATLDVWEPVKRLVFKNFPSPFH